MIKDISHIGETETYDSYNEIQAKVKSLTKYILDFSIKIILNSNANFDETILYKSFDEMLAIIFRFDDRFSKFCISKENLISNLIISI